MTVTQHTMLVKGEQRQRNITGLVNRNDVFRTVFNWRHNIPFLILFGFREENFSREFRTALIPLRTCSHLQEHASDAQFLSQLKSNSRKMLPSMQLTALSVFLHTSASAWNNPFTPFRASQNPLRFESNCCLKVSTFLSE